MDDISSFNVKALSLIFMDERECSTSCYEQNAVLSQNFKFFFLLMYDINI